MVHGSNHLEKGEKTKLSKNIFQQEFTVSRNHSMFQTLKVAEILNKMEYNSDRQFKIQ